MGGEAGGHSDLPERRNLRRWDVMLTRIIHVHVAHGSPGVGMLNLQENEPVLGFLLYLAILYFGDPTAMAGTVVFVAPFGSIEEEQHHQPLCEWFATEERRQLEFLPTQQRCKDIAEQMAESRPNEGEEVLEDFL